MKKEEAKVKYQAGEIQICYDVDNIDLLREVADHRFPSIPKGYYMNKSGRHKDYGPYDNLPIVNISEIIESESESESEEEVVWLQRDMQWFDGEKWVDCQGVANHKYRLKPKPDYEEEIIALQTKAIKNGMKAVITFKKL